MELRMLSCFGHETTSLHPIVFIFLDFLLNFIEKRIENRGKEGKSMSIRHILILLFF